jgi:cytochrome bd-I ubiquinol oxidase subunit X
MWYFSWMLGLGLACSFAILNAMWLEVSQDNGDAHPLRIIERQPRLSRRES